METILVELGYTSVYGGTSFTVEQEGQPEKMYKVGLHDLKDAFAFAGAAHARRHAYGFYDFKMKPTQFERFMNRLSGSLQQIK